jgi:hypothetical protein
MLAILSLAGNSQAYTWYWCNSSGDWANASTWLYGSGVPALTGESQSILYNSATVTVTTSGCGTVNLALGYSTDWSNDLGILSCGTLTIAQDIEWIQTGGECAIGHMGGHGILNVNGTVNATGTLRMATNNAYSTAIVNVNDGGNFRGHYANVGEVGSASINLNGNGIMEVTGVNLYGGRGHIDIEAGYLKVLGDYRTQLQNYVNNGWITSHGGLSSRCSLTVTFFGGYTFVKSTGCTCVTYLPADLNHDCYVDTLDLAVFAQGWMSCQDTENTNCVQ